MTAEEAAPHGAPGPDPFDSAAQPLSRVSARPGGGLPRVPPRAPAPPRPLVLVAVAHTGEQLTAAPEPAKVAQDQFVDAAAGYLARNA
ncbi:hypothetical protein PV392_31100 [Streptomyces sp. ME03-5709C]|nr:hypothetical protein [Streptomyces sp. ME03-5709C]